MRDNLPSQCCRVGVGRSTSVGAALKCHPNPRAPCGGVLCCDCILDQFLPLLSLDSFTPSDVLFLRALPNKLPTRSKSLFHNVS